MRNGALSEGPRPSTTLGEAFGEETFTMPLIGYFSLPSSSW
jgi:hypothetical protein